jgi:glutamate formiminotransferase
MLVARCASVVQVLNVDSDADRNRSAITVKGLLTPKGMVAATNAAIATELVELGHH